MVEIMLGKVRKWNADEKTAPRLIIISGEGGKAFCAGGDIRHVYDAHVGLAPASVKSSFFA